jgi:hypothetical protein
MVKKYVWYPEAIARLTICALLTVFDPDAPETAKVNGYAGMVVVVEVEVVEVEVLVVDVLVLVDVEVEVEVVEVEVLVEVVDATNW